MTVGVSIDFETATLTTSASKILNLRKKLEFLQNQYKKLQLQPDKGPFSKKDDEENSLIIEHIHNFLQHELQSDYSGNLHIDLYVLSSKLEEQRNYHECDNKMNYQKIIILQQQCNDLKMDLNEKDSVLRQYEIEQARMRQEFEMTFADMNKQQMYDQTSDEQKSKSESMEHAMTEIMTLSAAVQTEIKYFDDSAMNTDEISVCDSTSVQTELFAKDVCTMKEVNDLMMNKMDEQCDDIPIPKGLMITPENCLEFEFNEMQTLSSEDSTDDCKEQKKEKKEFAFGKELFLRTQQRIKRRKQYDASKNERMKKREARLKNFRMGLHQNANPYRCTKAKRN